MPTPVSLLDLTPDQLRDTLNRHFSERGQPMYRTEQVARWVYEEGAAGFQEMTDLPLEERSVLAEAFVLSEPPPATVSVSCDGTVKHLWRLSSSDPRRFGIHGLQFIRCFLVVQIQRSG